MKLSIIIPAYNEEQTIAKIVKKVLESFVSLEKEIIIVDDASKDATASMIESAEWASKVIFLKHSHNLGKGAAVRTGMQKSTGDIVLIQDADLEYDPSEYSKLVTPILNGEADVVFGSRFIGEGSHRVLYFWHFLGNLCLTLFSNICTNLNLTDMETCYKVFTKKILHSVAPHLTSKGFGFEPEFTALISKIPGVRIYEVGISYRGRTYEEGKKISWKDGLRALFLIPYFNIVAKSKMRRQK